MKVEVLKAKPWMKAQRGDVIEVDNALGNDAACRGLVRIVERGTNTGTPGVVVKDERAAAYVARQRGEEQQEDKDDGDEG